MTVRKAAVFPLLFTTALILPAAPVAAQTEVYPDRDATPDSLVTDPRGVTPDPGQNLATGMPERGITPGHTVADRIHGYRVMLDDGVPDKPVTHPRGATPRPGINRDVVQ